MLPPHWEGCPRDRLVQRHETASSSSYINLGRGLPTSKFDLHAAPRTRLRPSACPMARRVPPRSSSDPQSLGAGGEPLLRSGGPGATAPPGPT